jgi:hypothetical protein
MIHSDEILARIAPGDRVLDVGGWACPFNRADWVIDCQPYETRGYYATVGLPGSQGGEREYYSHDSWVTRDICDREPWPFPDKWFDFSICSHTLEDVRDPLYVCSELIRVSKRGYIETPSRLAETCRGWESERTAGLNHHHWLIDYGPARLDFTMKWHLIHADRSFTFPPRLFRNLTRAEAVSWMFWEDRFEFVEAVIHGREKKAEILRGFVAKVAADERFHGLAADDPFEDESLREQLEATRAQLAECRVRLAQYDEIGPLAMKLARRLRRVSGLIQPLARLARSRRPA